MSGQPIALRSFDGIQPAVIHAPPTPAPDEIAAEAARAEAERAEAKAEQAAEDARRAAEAEGQAALTRALADVAASTGRARVAAIAALSAALGDATKTLLPALAEAGLAEEVAIATKDVLERAAIVEARLRVPPEAHERIVKALRNVSPMPSIEVVDDPGLAAGGVELEWHDGGASFDAEHLVLAALERLGQHTDRLLRKNSDE